MQKKSYTVQQFLIPLAKCIFNCSKKSNCPPPHNTVILHAYLYVIVTQKKKENLSERATSYLQKTAEVVKTLKIMIFAEAPLPQLKRPFPWLLKDPAWCLTGVLQIALLSF